MKLDRNTMVLVVVAAFSFGILADDVGKVFKDSFEAESKGKYQDAHKILETGYGQASDRAMFYTMRLRLGYLDGLMQKYDESATEYEAAARLYPNSVEPLVYVQYQYLMLKDWKKLLDAATRALKIDANHYLSHCRLAYASYCLADYATASKEYGRVLELYPGDLDVMNMLGWCCAQQKDKLRATQYFQFVLTVYPDNKPAQEGMDFLKKTS